jgi:hypothetical protein
VFVLVRWHVGDHGVQPQKSRKIAAEFRSAWPRSVAATGRCLVGGPRLRAPPPGLGICAAFLRLFCGYGLSARPQPLTCANRNVRDFCGYCGYCGWS